MINRGWLLSAIAIVGLVLLAVLVRERDSLPWLDDQPTAIERQSGPGVVGVIVEPDDGREPILEEIEAATRSITLEVYLLSDDEIISALERAVERGIEVRVILEEHPFGGGGDQPEVFDRLEETGIAVRWSSRAYTFTHIKTMIVDEATSIIMNQNLTWSAFEGNREFAVLTTRPEDVAHAVAIFEADWSKTDETPDGPLVVSPTNSRTVLTRLISDATATLDVYAEVVRDRKMIEALGLAAERGVRVRLIMSSDPGEGDVERAALMRSGVEVRLVDRVYIHAKALIIDGDRAFIGSQNMTATSLDENRELGIVVEEKANVERIATVFETDFAMGKQANLENSLAKPLDTDTMYVYSGRTVPTSQRLRVLLPPGPTTAGEAAGFRPGPGRHQGRTAKAHALRGDVRRRRSTRTGARQCSSSGPSL